MTEINDSIFAKAMEEASKVLGADPAYFGEEGSAEVDRQLKKLGRSLDEIKKKGWLRMRTREEIEAKLFEIYEMIEVGKSEIEDLEREVSHAYEKMFELEAELSALDQSEGEGE
ncbi:hypothetical protein NSS78_16290 [Bacillus sp. FSL W8-0920]|uniref:hypothetical protein n=1 Tax=Bacillus TaxID=1386 RepID=UPI00209C72E2|nr:hypothetical protein [Bacillus pumilus]MCP1528579.1 uncharacterized protein YecA (UPF0149 family) [Bacillus pumilus]MDF9783959.1 uncharacterized protein YecA (UPF0149 family) [Bacillus pumilus]MED1527878.1 hypothetical protein [Bacillus pumilus]